MGVRVRVRVSARGEGEAQGAVSVCTGCTAQGLGTLRLDEQLAHRVAERALARYRVRREPRLGLAWFGLGCGCGFGFGCGLGFGLGLTLRVRVNVKG